MPEREDLCTAAGLLLRRPEFHLDNIIEEQLIQTVDQISLALQIETQCAELPFFDLRDLLLEAGKGHPVENAKFHPQHRVCPVAHDADLRGRFNARG